MITQLAYLLCLFSIANGGNQPWPLKIDKVSSCCKKMSVVESLYDCVRGQSGMDSSDLFTSKVVLLSSAVVTSGSHAMNDLRNFTQYQLMLVSAYAEQNGYTYISMDDPDDASHEPDDIRWNKIKLLVNALDPNEGWARNSEFIVWIDADAIVLDYGFYIEDVGSEFPSADIIASADLRMGLINTGMMVLRNTPWTREFLRRWWSIADRKVVCDQDAFDILYKQYLEDENQKRLPKGQGISAKVKVLAMDRLNSHPPAMLHQQPHNPILHLMGESTVMRTTVFRQAAQAVCDASEDGEPLPQQLGITRKFLLTTASDVYKAEVTQRLQEASDVNKAGPAEFDRLSLSAHHYCDILEHLAEQKERGKPSEEQKAEIKLLKDEILSLRDQVLRLSLANVEHRKAAIAARTENQAFVSDIESMTNYALMLKRAAESGNDVYRSTDSYEDKKKTAKLVLKLCDALTEAVSEESKYVPKHMKALMTQSLGKLEYDRSHQAATGSDREAGLRAALKALKKSLQYFEEAQTLQASSGTARTEHSMSLQMVAGITCQLGDRTSGMQLWLNAIDQAEASTDGVEMGVHFEALPTVYLNAAICFTEASQMDQSTEFIDRAVATYTKTASNKSGYPVGSRELKNALKNNDFLGRAESLRASIKAASKPSEPKKKTESTLSKTAETVKAKLDPVKSRPSEQHISGLVDADIVVEWEECEDINDCEDEVINSVDSAKEVSAGFPEDDPSIYEGLSRQEAQALKETRERYARTASRFYVNRNKVSSNSNAPEISVASDSVGAGKEVPIADLDESTSSRYWDNNGVETSQVFAEDDESVYEGLSESEVEALREVRERYARVASRYEVNRRRQEEREAGEGRSGGITRSSKVGEKGSSTQQSVVGLVDSDDDAIMYEGLNEEEVEEMKERRERYAIESEGKRQKIMETADVKKETSAVASKLKWLEFRVKELELELSAANQQNKILTEKIALLESYLKT